MAEKEESEERSSPSSKVVYHAISQEGEDELERPTSALAWSGVAAGLSMGFSFVGAGLLASFLPDAPWRTGRHSSCSRRSRDSDRPTQSEWPC